ncbi:MAG: exopolyphosphatase [Deltaproteobacteria bacterium]|jgi:exopolyphosphatase/guanosine-5'-triphosphate,3'-diphosphate pyrophosphatase|nr:exopolyphosphatase [Deltaproteobacteria bacterium]
MPPDRLAALDLGSNTFRLILASPVDGGPGGRRVWQEIPRLSEGLSPGGSLAEEPKRRAMEALEGFAAAIGAEAPLRVLAGGTMVFREARDGRDFMAAIGRRFGWETLVLSGDQEAFLSARGVLSGLGPVPPESLIFDVGGRSTEFAVARGRDIVGVQSLPLGVVGLTEAHVAADPPRPGELLAMEAAVLETLARGDWGLLGPGATLVGTAGTVTTIAAMLMGLGSYDPGRVNNAIVGQEGAMDLLGRLARLSTGERRSLPGLHPRRADVIVAGLVLVLSIMDYFSKAKMIVSDNSLLEGLWLAAAGLAPITPQIPEEDP